MENENIAGEMPVDNGGEEVVTPTTEVTDGIPSQEQENPFTRERVTQIIKKRTERLKNTVLSRYGVKSFDELDELFNKTKSFDQMQNEFGNIQLRNSELAQENAFLKNNINPERYDDIKAYFKGKGLEFSEETLLDTLSTHPEWLKQQAVQSTQIETLGSEKHAQPKEDEKKIASKIFGVEL